MPVDLELEAVLRPQQYPMPPYPPKTIVLANGKVMVATVNAAGNFFLKAGKSGGSLATPYTARVVQGSKERRMFGAQSSGDCNSCHTQQGDSGAPGRIRAP